MPSSHLWQGEEWKKHLYKLKNVEERPYQTQAPLILDQPRAQELWVERFVLLLRVPTGIREGAAGLSAGDNPQGWGVAKCDSTRALSLWAASHPLYARSSISALAWGIFPYYYIRKTAPKSFSTQAVAFLSPSSFRGTLAMEKGIDGEPIAMSCDCCYSSARCVSWLSFMSFASVFLAIIMIIIHLFHAHCTHS